MANKKNERKYLVVKRVGDHDEYVWDKYEENTSIDCPNGADDFLTYEEANELCSYLCGYAQGKGWVNVLYFIEEQKPTMTLQEAVNELRNIQDKCATMENVSFGLNFSTKTEASYWCVSALANTKTKQWVSKQWAFSEDCADEFARQINEIKNFLNL